MKDKKLSLLRGYCSAVLANIAKPSDLKWGEPSYSECKHGFMEVMCTIWKERGQGVSGAGRDHISEDKEQKAT